MFDKRGSVWRKWDLHVHTPESLVHNYTGRDPWARFIKELQQLPADFKVLGINDYIFLDGYKKVVEAWQRGDLPNIELVLPVIELRLDKFGGSKSGLSRVNFHVVFSNELPVDVIEAQFVSAICSKYTLAPEYDGLRSKWAAAPTRASLTDLGQRIIDSVPEEERSKFHPPLIEGFNNLCFNLDHVREVLSRPHFKDRVVTAVGKAEWADIKWNDQSIADKKTVINGVDLVFTAAASPEDAAKGRAGLQASGVNHRLFDCSDAHHFSDSEDKDRLGNCFTWVKADPTFEGLRQALFEYDSRVSVGADRPLEPLIQLKEVTLTFPLDTNLASDGHQDQFCFRGNHVFPFSPFLTCIIGGRGTGKSTLLKLIHERLAPGATEFFRRNQLTPSEATAAKCVHIDGVNDLRSIEFLQQNEIEQFASDHQKLTDAVFARMRKLEGRELLEHAETQVLAQRDATQAELERTKQQYRLKRDIAAANRELIAKKEIVQSFASPDYRAISGDLAVLVKELQSLRTSKDRLEKLVTTINAGIAEWTATSGEVANGYDAYALSIAGIIHERINDTARASALGDTQAREAVLAFEAGQLREQLDAFLRGRGLSAENLSDVSGAAEAIAMLEERVTASDKSLAAVAAESAAFVATRQPAEDYRSAIEKLLAPLNKTLAALGAEVKPIELQYRFDAQAFREVMIAKVGEAIGPIDGRAARPDYVNSVLSGIDFAKLPGQAETIKAIVDNGVYARRIREYLAEQANYAMLELQAELALLDVDAFGKIAILYDGKALDHSSFGQRCTAVIVVLLSLGNTPIIIDEPEAHLDSSLIARYLVNLVKERKNHRQIIFATHNANFVINGDAELVHCMSMDAERIAAAASTTIEDLEHRELLLALEGGELAFQQRERRYGIQ